MSLTHKELDEMLKTVRIPERSADYWKHFPMHVISQLRDQPILRSENKKPSVAWRWGFGLATACSIALLILFSKQGRDERKPPPDQVAHYRKVFQEIDLLFPNQVESITSELQGLKIVLTDKPQASASAPLLLRICDGDHCRDVITFSGQQIQIGQELCDVLVDSRGHIIVTGRQMIWCSEDAMSGDSRITGQLLEAS